MAFGRGTRSIARQRNQRATRQSIARQSATRRSIETSNKTQMNTTEIQNQLTKSLAKIIPILEAKISKEIEAKIAKEIEAKYKSKIQMLEAEIKKLKIPLESMRYKYRLPTINENNL